jgi:hypothetical protein
MIAITVGQNFLKAYNLKYQQSHTAKSFFETVFFDMFFNHPKYMLWHTNSPFVQMKKGQKPFLLSEEERKEKLANLTEKIAAGDRDASVAIGFPASEAAEFATTSGLVSDLEMAVTETDVYYSWIGAGLGIGVSGGYCIFFTEPDLLLLLYEGWHIYRKFLNDSTLDKLAPNKINSWNGQWLSFRCSKKFRQSGDEGSVDFGYLDQLQVFTKNAKGDILIDPVKWSRLFFNLSRTLEDRTLMGYVFSMGQTNKTIGFFPFYFHQARNLIYYYRKLFGENAAIRDSRAYENMFGTHFNRACELGAIGLQALQPMDLKSYFRQGKIPNFKKAPEPSPKKEETPDQFSDRRQKASDKDYEKIILFRTFKTWLVAMLTKNKEEMLDYTREIAQALHAYRSKGGKTVHKSLIEKELLAAGSKKKFIDALARMVTDIDPSYLETIRDLKKLVHLMTAEDFGYFSVLLRFDYAYEERNI